MAVNPSISLRRDIPTQVKDQTLVAEQRVRIVRAAVDLFVHKGYHQTTTREIARCAGFSIGTLYEYIESKEDILYLVCESIHAEMEARIRDGVGGGHKHREVLEHAIGEYIRACDRMQDSILLIYRETASLKPESARFVLQNEERIASVFEDILDQGVRSGEFHPAGDKTLRLMAHNIIVLGHMWAFRRWFLRELFSLEEYILHQTSLIMGELI